MADQIKSQIFSGIKWNSIGQLVRQSYSIVISIILARLLLPEEFGLVAMLFIFAELANAFVNSGLSASLIQRKNISSEECSTVFYFSIAVALFLYVLFYLSAPLIAHFYENDALINLVKFYALGFLLRSFDVVPNALFTRNLNYKTINTIQSVASISSGVVAVCMAYLGYGPYSLVGQAIALSAVSAIMSNLLSNWKPTFVFSISKFKEMYSFGVRIFFASLLDKIFNAIDNMIIGKLFGANILGFYNRGKSTKDIPVRNMVNIATNIVFPIFSKIDSINELRSVFNRYIGLISYVICPVMLMLFITSDSFIYLLFSEKWMQSVPYLRLFCILGITIPFNNVMAHTILSRGDYKKYLRIELVKKGVIFIGMVFGLFFDAYWFLLILVVTHYIGLLIITIEVAKYIKSSALDIIKIIMPPFVISMLIIIPMYFIGTLNIWSNELIKFVVQCVVGIISYYLFSAAFRISEQRYIISEIKNRFNTSIKSS
ncbi:lipopolysaccharide biosynthesis protein [Fulvivirga lutea]|uniref:Lipopolysaccharide biosynthesis protein n=1 Tax=Fulvivirga lutea TaxID=2810512 RepID=A0A975A229_9BACT|nr:lipopolysaccharide biosynthesis protein [Fulvivirga lutea]QSE98441.1 lipopolysaccharide biosynthesis protein [Fulvivirga lutea]